MSELAIGCHSFSLTYTVSLSPLCKKLSKIPPTMHNFNLLSLIYWKPYTPIGRFLYLFEHKHITIFSSPPFQFLSPIDNVNSHKGKKKVGCVWISPVTFREQNWTEFMASFSIFSLLFIHICLLLGLSFAEDPFVNYNFVVSYITVSPLGIPQQVSFF